MGGKYNRGLAVIDTYRILAGQDSLEKPGVYEKLAILGWTVELVCF